MSEILELLHYQTYRLLFPDGTRKIMDEKVKRCLEDHDIKIGSFQHARGRNELPNRQANHPSNVQDMPP